MVVKSLRTITIEEFNELDDDLPVVCPKEKDDSCTYQYNDFVLADYVRGRLATSPKCENCGCFLALEVPNGFESDNVDSTRRRARGRTW